MRKTIFLALFAIGIASINAQTKKGDLLLGTSFGSMSFTDSKSTTTYSNTPTVYSSNGNSFSISVNPTVAWFVQDNLAVGAGVSLSFYTSKSDSSNTSSTTTSTSKSNQPAFYIGPYARYYFGGSEKGMPFAQASFQFGISGGKSNSSTSTGSTSETTSKPKGDWNGGVSLGYEHFVSKYIGIFGMVGVNYGKSKTTYEYRPSTGTGYDYTSEYNRWYVPINFGIQVHLPASRGE